MKRMIGTKFRNWIKKMFKVVQVDDVGNLEVNGIIKENVMPPVKEVQLNFAGQLNIIDYKILDEDEGKVLKLIPNYVGAITTASPPYLGINLQSNKRFIKFNYFDCFNGSKYWWSEICNEYNGNDNYVYMKLAVRSGTTDANYSYSIYDYVHVKVNKDTIEVLINYVS